MNTINVYEHGIPGLGKRFDIALNQQDIVTVVALDNGRRQLLRRDVDDDDTAAVFIDLDRDQAATIGALLLGAQFSEGVASDDAEPTDRVVVDTITVTHGAPAIDQTPSNALCPLGDDIAVLAVIRDHTPELIEDDPETELNEGDQVVIAVRRSHHHLVARALTGW